MQPRGQAWAPKNHQFFLIHMSYNPLEESSLAEAHGGDRRTHSETAVSRTDEKRLVEYCMVDSIIGD
jgi:hypothetical protein